jgi:hypothetical protein
MKGYAKSSLYDLQENLLLKFHVDGWELRKYIAHNFGCGQHL